MKNNLSFHAYVNLNTTWNKWLALKYQCPEKTFGENRIHIALNRFGSVYGGVKERAKGVIILIPGEVTSPFLIEELFFNGNSTYYVGIYIEVLTGDPSKDSF